MEVAARLAVLVACAVAAGTLFVLVAAPVRVRPPADPPHAPPLAGLAPASLATFILLAGGSALTGAGAGDAGAAASVVALAGIGILVVAGLLTGRAALRVLGASSAGEAAAAPSPTLLVLAWTGAALALASWLLAIGAVVVALLTSVRVEGRAP